jgi:hypothetical protein
MSEDEHHQFIRQYRGDWYVCVEGSWNGSVGFLSTDEHRVLRLIQEKCDVDRSYWAIPDE